MVTHGGQLAGGLQRKSEDFITDKAYCSLENLTVSRSDEEAPVLHFSSQL